MAEEKKKKLTFVAIVTVIVFEPPETVVHGRRQVRLLILPCPSGTQYLVGGWLL